MKDFKENQCALAGKHCKPCRGGVEPLGGEALDKLAKELGSGWNIVEEHHIEKEYKFKDFARALGFVNRIGVLAEKEGHHPDIYLAWGKVILTFWTHKIKGLSENDFIMAAKADEIFSCY